MSSGYLENKITVVEGQIDSAEEALLALTNKTVQSYTVDTGQTRSTFTRLNLSELSTLIDSLYNRRATLLSRCTGLGSYYGVPGF